MKKKVWFYIRIILVIVLIALPLTAFILETKDDAKGVVQGNNENLVLLDWHEKEDLSDPVLSFPKKLNVKSNEKKTVYALIDVPIKSDSCLGLKTLMQNLEVRINDELIYEYDTTSSRRFGKASPSTFHIIDIAKEAENQIISITISSPYDRCSGLFNAMFIGPKLSIVEFIYNKYLPRTIMACVLMVIDVALIFASFLFFKQKDKFRKAIYQFVAVFFLSIYFISTGMLTNAFISPGLNLTIVFYSFMFFSLFLVLYYYEKYNHKYKKTFYVFFSCAVLNIIVSTILHLTNLYDLYETVLVTGTFNMVLFVTDICFSIKNFKYYIKNDSPNKQGNFVFRLADIILTVLTIILFCIEFFSNYNYQYFHNIPLCLTFLINICMVYGYLAYNVALDSKNSVIYKAELAETKTYLVQSQMKPHFIFNTLGAIRAMINSNPKKAYDLTTSFSKYLRANIGDISFNEPIPFSKELDHVRAYLDIELERFRGRLNVEFDIQSSDFNINPLTVEPLVENAVKHGVCKKIEGGTVKIKTYDTDECHMIEVIDDGVGFNVADLNDMAKENKSVGIKYIKYRVEKMGGCFNIESTPGVGTVARICIKK